MSSLERAVEIAARAHAGQTDKAGSPYILHPIRVMLAVSAPEEQIVAILHDVVEDTDITFEHLEKQGFSRTIIEALVSLTKLPGESRSDAAARARTNPIARIVKLADIQDNMNLSRISNPTSKDFARLAEYEDARAILLA